MPSKLLIYGLVDPRTDAVRYIGKSTNGLLRPRQHMKPSAIAKDGNRHKAFWLLQLKALGWTCGIRVFEEVQEEDAGALGLIERFWIAQAREAGWPLVNLTDGGDGPTGRRHTDEAKARIGAASRGRLHTPEECARMGWQSRGKTRPPEVRAKISAALRGRAVRTSRNAPGHTYSAETIAKMSESMRNSERHKAVMASPEYRAKMSAALKGRKFTPEHRAKLAAAAARRRHQTTISNCAGEPS